MDPNDKKRIISFNLPQGLIDRIKFTAAQQKRSASQYLSLVMTALFKQVDERDK